MSDKPQASQQHGGSADIDHLVREGHAMRRVVRNMVANMESVLNDLQGIMGDIQSLVVQIDTVTDKIDKQCGALGDSSSPQSSRHCVRKPHFVHGASLLPSAVSNAMYLHSEFESTSMTPAETLRQASDIPCHSVLHIKAFRKEKVAEVSAIPHEDPRPQGSELPISIDKTREVTIPRSSKSFSHFSKESSVTSPSGGIAIVHPTIKSSGFVHSVDNGYEAANEQKLERLSNKPRNMFQLRRSPTNPGRLTSNVHHVFPSKSFQANESKQAASKSKHGITSVYNKYFQPVTPTEQRSPVISMGHRRSQPYAAKHKMLSPSVTSNLLLHESKPYRVTCPTSERSYVSNSLSHKYCTIGGSLTKSYQTQPESPFQNLRVMPSSPLMKRSQKGAYSKMQGSPVCGRSPGSVRRAGGEHYYFSIESDLDSEALIESLDNRSMTPDIDWSYLNLVGNDNFRGNATKKLEKLASDQDYEIPVTSIKDAQSFQMIQNCPDVTAKRPIIKVQSVTSHEAFDGRDSNATFQGPCFLDIAYNSPVIAHVFCSEVSSFRLFGYCGCYESVLDSVLENIAGFESFEDACEDLDSQEALTETYINFEDDFEEDDWDMGMKADDHDEYELSVFDIHAMFNCDRGLFERLEGMDDNRNIFPTNENTVPFKSCLFNTNTHTKECFSLVNNSVVHPMNNKRRLSPAFTDADMYDDVLFQEATGNSFTDDDCCVLMPVNTNYHQNFSLWHKSFVPTDLNLFREGMKPKIESETEMSSSDDTSCQAIGSGSPMSFSSPEAALTSPDTDRFVTSSEGDDLFTSQEEAYFNLSDTQENVNLSTARENMLQLRREFFQSLYSVCEKKEQERARDNESITLPEEFRSYDQSFSRIDNSRDNISEAGSYQEDITSYNKSINTWTAYTMVHMQADDISDSTSDIFNDNNITCSMTSSYLDADNIGSAPANQGLTC